MYKLTTLIYLTMISMAQAVQPWSQAIDDPYAEPMGAGGVIVLLILIIGALLYGRR